MMTNLEKIQTADKAEEVAKIIKDIAHNYLFDTMLGNKELDLIEWLESECEEE